MLEVRRLSKVFFEQNDPRKPGLVALYDVSLSIRRNEFVSLLGPSGCGKTTLIRIIAGLLAPDRGEVLVNGQRVTAPGRDRCMVFQQFGLLAWRGQSGAPPRKSISKLSASKASKITIRIRFRAACSSGSASPARCRKGR